MIDNIIKTLCGIIDTNPSRKGCKILTINTPPKPNRQEFSKHTLPDKLNFFSV